MDEKAGELTRGQVEYRPYQRKQIAELADWKPGFDMTGVSVSDADKAAGSPKEGDKIARNTANHADRWLVAADYFAANFEPLHPLRSLPAGGMSEGKIERVLKNLDYHASFGLKQDQSIAGEAAIAIRQLQAALAQRNRGGAGEVSAVQRSDIENECADMLLEELGRLGINTANWDGDEGLWPTLARCIASEIKAAPAAGEKEEG